MEIKVHIWEDYDDRRWENFSYVQCRSIALLLTADPDRRSCLVLIDESFSWNLGCVWTCHHPCRWSSAASENPIQWGCCRWTTLLILTQDTWKIRRWFVSITTPMIFVKSYKIENFKNFKYTKPITVRFRRNTYNCNTDQKFRIVCSIISCANLYC